MEQLSISAYLCSQFIRSHRLRFCDASAEPFRQIITANQKSRWRELGNGLPTGSICHELMTPYNKPSGFRVKTKAGPIYSAGLSRHVSRYSYQGLTFSVNSACCIDYRFDDSLNRFEFVRIAKRLGQLLHPLEIFNET